MARKKVTPEEEIVNTAVEGTALGSVPAGSVLHDEAGADTGDVPAELPEGDLSAEETAEQSETLPAMEQPRRSRLDYLQQKNCIPRRK